MLIYVFLNFSFFSILTQTAFFSNFAKKWKISKIDFAFLSKLLKTVFAFCKFIKNGNFDIYGTLQNAN